MEKPDTDIRCLKGVGESHARSLARLGITDLRSLLEYFPRGYEDRRTYKKIADLVPGEMSCVCAVVAGEAKLSRVRKGLDLVKLRAVDETGALKLTYFNQSYLKNTFHTGDAYVFFGRAEGTPSRPQMTNPLFEREGAHQITGRIMPVYPLTKGVSQAMLCRETAQALDICADGLPDELPEEVRMAHGLCHVRYAYENIHFPADDEALATARPLRPCLRHHGGRRPRSGQLFPPAGRQSRLAHRTRKRNLRGKGASLPLHRLCPRLNC